MWGGGSQKVAAARLCQPGIEPGHGGCAAINGASYLSRLYTGAYELELAPSCAKDSSDDNATVASDSNEHDSTKNNPSTNASESDGGSNHTSTSTGSDAVRNHRDQGHTSNAAGSGKGTSERVDGEGKGELVGNDANAEKNKDTCHESSRRDGREERNEKDKRKENNEKSDGDESEKKETRGKSDNGNTHEQSHREREEAGNVGTAEKGGNGDEIKTAERSHGGDSSRAGEDHTKCNDSTEGESSTSGSSGSGTDVSLADRLGGSEKLPSSLAALLADALIRLTATAQIQINGQGLDLGRRAGRQGSSSNPISSAALGAASDHRELAEAHELLGDPPKVHAGSSPVNVSRSNRRKLAVVAAVDEETRKGMEAWMQDEVNALMGSGGSSSSQSKERMTGGKHGDEKSHYQGEHGEGGGVGEKHGKVGEVKEIVGEVKNHGLVGGVGAIADDDVSGCESGSCTVSCGGDCGGDGGGGNRYNNVSIDNNGSGYINESTYNNGNRYSNVSIDNSRNGYVNGSSDNSGNR
ncbi:unnamed protein product [Closterium sp. NIES-64]|nr:unnamed protein product [Closterium sp. NIES-64]